MMEWLQWIENETLHLMHRDLLRHGVFADGNSDEERLTAAVLTAIEREAGRRTMGVSEAPEKVK
jgi:hypothetical protein